MKKSALNVASLSNVSKCIQLTQDLYKFHCFVALLFSLSCTSADILVSSNICLQTIYNKLQVRKTIYNIPMKDVAASHIGTASIDKAAASKFNSALQLEAATHYNTVSRDEESLPDWTAS